MAESIGRVNYRADTLDMTSLVLKMLIYMRSLAFFFMQFNTTTDWW